MMTIRTIKTKSDLFNHISTILIQARNSIVRTIDNTMVLAYWNIGREIVLEFQHGGNRAGYGTEMIEKLSAQLISKFGRGFSTTNLRYFRTFYTVYADRSPEIRHFRSGELEYGEKRHLKSGVLEDMTTATDLKSKPYGFSPNLGWTHYRTLMSVEHPSERLFYEIEADKERWGIENLKHQIHTFLFA
jgi:hypothetical protein